MKKLIAIVLCLALVGCAATFGIKFYTPKERPAIKQQRSDRAEVSRIWRAAQKVLPDELKDKKLKIDLVYSWERWSTISMGYSEKATVLLGLYDPHRNRVYVWMGTKGWKVTVAHEIVHVAGYRHTDEWEWEMFRALTTEVMIKAYPMEYFMPSDNNRRID